MNNQRLLLSIVFLVSAVSWFQENCYAQPQERAISFRVSSSTQTATVRGLLIGSSAYISVKDIAGIFSVRYYENMIIKKAEIQLNRVVLKFTADNSFVVSTDLDTKMYYVHQFADPTILANDLYFVPAQDFTALLQSQYDSSLEIEIDTSAVAIHETRIPTVTGFSTEEKRNGLLLRIHLSAPVKDFNRSLQIGDWMYVTLPGAVGDTIKLDTSITRGIIRRIQPIQSETALQLSIQLRTKLENSEIVQDITSSDILVTLITSSVFSKQEKDSIRKAQKDERLRRESATNIEKQKMKWKLDVIVLDAGHGGYDPGTIGTIGTREKDITLGISLRLGELIEKYMPGVKVVYTRKTDKFVELYRRGQIANETGGKLFISIHCNSTERKPSSTNGFEIYLLRPGKTEDAIRVAEKENAVVKLEKDFEDRYQNLTEENFIILTMAQSAYVKQSEHLAELLEETMSVEMEAQRQAVKQAGFYVLVGASMPNVLIETGYLSNPKEERFLRNPSGQRKIAEAILKALQGYKREYEKEIE